MRKSIIFICILVFMMGCKNSNSELTPQKKSCDEIESTRGKYSAGCEITVAFIGDSTSMGFGANAGENTWTNGISYMFNNLPGYGPNFNQESEFYLAADFPYISQEHQDNLSLKSAVRLFRTRIESNNSESKVYNYSGSGWTAGTHIDYDTVFELSQLEPKPSVVFVNLGINSSKNNSSQKSDLISLVNQAISINMVPVLVKPNNIAVAYSTYGNWSESASPNDWYPKGNWPTTRDEIDEVAEIYNLKVIDTGSDDGYIDITLLYDPFHPNEKGYKVISELYIKWMNSLESK